MTSWPILERELRVWARRRVTYWARFTVAAGGILVCATPLLWIGSFVAPAAAGRYAFDGLVGAAFMLSCAACLLTADAISSERREGTLGLLLLTRMKHLDLLLGKLASSGLASVLGLVALMPLLAVPLLIGGVSGGEAVRKAVALLVTLFMALSIGLWASARGLEKFRTAGVALLALTVFVLGPTMLGLIFASTYLALASPLTALSQAADLTYRVSPGRFWSSLGLVQMIAWGFVLTGARRLKRCAQKMEEPMYGGVARAKRRTGMERLRSGALSEDSRPATSGSMDLSVMQCPYCGQYNSTEASFCTGCGTELKPKRVERASPWNVFTAPTPLHWLLSRQRGLKPLLWVAACISCLHLALFEMLGRFVGVGMGTSWLGIFPVVGLAEATIEGSLFAWVASRFLVEARRTGELELLLTTPLGAEELLLAQWQTLKRLAQRPVVVMVGLPLILQGLFTVAGPSAPWKIYYGLSLLLSTADSIVSVVALFWLAPWFGLRVVGQGRVIFWTVLLVKGLPYLASVAWALFYRPLINRVGAQGNPWGSLWFLGFLVPQVATLLLYWWLIRAARRQLLRPGGTEPLDASELPSRALAQLAGFVHRARNWPAG